MARHPDVKCLIVVHYGGQAAEMQTAERPGILELCARRSVRVVEDAAHAFPARQGGRAVGSLGDATCFSFYANKTITTGEGGMLVSNDEALIRRARVMRLHGIDRDVWNRFTTAGASWEYDVVAPGYKYNMPDLAAAVGLAQLERAWDMRRERERCARFYLRELAECKALDLPMMRCPFEDHAWHLFPVVVRPDAQLSRNRCVELLAENGIGTSVHYKPLHRMTYYRDTYGLDPGDFPNAEAVWRGCLSLPIYPALSDDDLGYVCDTLKTCLAVGDGTTP
jgi:dTDP-4-amino-4,6-dideoxygalactose transaminase